MGVPAFNPAYNYCPAVDVHGSQKPTSATAYRDGIFLRSVQLRQLEDELKLLLPKYRFHKDKSVMYYDKIESAYRRLDRLQTRPDPKRSKSFWDLLASIEPGRA